MNDFLVAIGMQHMDILPVAVKLALAALLGSALGFERAKKRRAAGIRTHGMVCLGAAIVMMTGIALCESFGMGDPARLGAQVVSGIGFLGAGAIIVTGYHQIQGLTTAAGLWVAACIGLAIGAGYYLAAIIACVVVGATMFIGSKVQDKIVSRSNRLRLLVFFNSAADVLEFVEFAVKSGFSVYDYEHISVSADAKTGVIFSIKIPDGQTHEACIEKLSAYAGVGFIERL